VLLSGAYPEFFRGGRLIFFHTNGEILGVFGIFFLKNPSKLKEITQNGDFDQYSPSLVVVDGIPMLSKAETETCPTFLSKVDGQPISII